MRSSPKLLAAIMLMRRGEPLPVDLVFDLASLGYDVPALETRYGL